MQNTSLITCVWLVTHILEPYSHIASRADETWKGTADSAMSTVVPARTVFHVPLKFPINAELLPIWLEQAANCPWTLSSNKLTRPC